MRKEKRRRGRSRHGRVLDLMRVKFVFMRGEIMVKVRCMGTRKWTDIILCVVSTSGKNTPKSSPTKEIFVSSGACNKEM
jgi:hypothetical protein